MEGGAHSVCGHLPWENWLCEENRRKQKKKGETPCETKDEKEACRKNCEKTGLSRGREGRRQEEQNPGRERTVKTRV